MAKEGNSRIVTMMDTILGKKIKMDQAFVDDARVPVTIIDASPNVVTQVKTMDTDGYDSVQLGFDMKRTKNISKAMQGHLKKFTTEGKAPKFLREVKGAHEVSVGDSIEVSKVFSEGDIVAVTGTSKGKGFAGVIKRWGFKGGPKTHGQSDRHRSPGSIGMGGTTPGRVAKGKKMGGRMGGGTVTVRNLKVVSINKDTNQLLVSGPVPGVPGGLVIVKLIKKSQNEQN